jgi:hypothetical protein
MTDDTTPVEGNSEPTKMDRFKKHMYDNRKVYIVGAVCLVVGATVATIIVKKGALPAEVINELNNDVTSKAAINGVAIHSPVTSNTFNTVVANFPEMSTPSKVVQCLEDGWVERSIGEAAKRAGISKPQLSTHLNNPDKVPSLRGKHYSFVPKIDPDVAEALTNVAEAA